nr:hypothetical protein [Tanacetum cinerariifolium]
MSSYVSTPLIPGSICVILETLKAVKGVKTHFFFGEWLQKETSSILFAAQVTIARFYGAPSKEEYTSRKLVPKSYPFIEDSNVVYFDIGHRVYDGNSTVSPQKQCLDGSSRISFPAIDVSFYGVWNITNISDDVVSSTNIRQSRSKHNPPVTSGTSSATSAQPEYVVSNSSNHSRGRRNHSKHNPPVTSGTSSTTSVQPEYILSSSNNRSRGRRSHSKQNPPITGGTSSEQPPLSGPQ